MNIDVESFRTHRPPGRSELNIKSLTLGHVNIRQMVRLRFRLRTKSGGGFISQNEREICTLLISLSIELVVVIIIIKQPILTSHSTTMKIRIVQNNFNTAGVLSIITPINISTIVLSTTPNKNQHHLMTIPLKSYRSSALMITLPTP